MTQMRPDGLVAVELCQPFTAVAEIRAGSRWLAAELGGRVIELLNAAGVEANISDPIERLRYKIDHGNTGGSMTTKERVPPVAGAKAASDSVEVTQSMVNQFADATLDHNWIHVDVERATAGPFGAPIAHGFFTLALCSYLMTSVLDVSGYQQTINYGVNRVRFPRPLTIGSRVRATVEVLAMDESSSGIQMTCRAVLQTETGGKPVCVAETVTLLLG